MEEAIRIYEAEQADDRSLIKSPQRFARILDLLLTHRGNPSAEIDRLLADDPKSVFGHCLRAALIVCADDNAARASLAQSVTAIEAAARTFSTWRAVMQRRHSLGWKAIRLSRSNNTAAS